MTDKIRVAILEDHQSITDGYLYRLNATPNIEVAATLAFGEDLEPTLGRSPVDVLLLDVNVPTAEDNTNAFPILFLIPKLLERYPELNVLVISMHAERGLIKAVMEAGASGYILKDDRTSIQDLGNLVVSIANGGIYLSQKAHQLLLYDRTDKNDKPLTPRQIEVLSLCAAYPDSSLGELASKLGVSNSTIRNLLSGAYIRIGVHTRAAAIAKAHELGIVSPQTPALQT